MMRDVFRTLMLVVCASCSLAAQSLNMMLYPAGPTGPATAADNWYGQTAGVPPSLYFRQIGTVPMYEPTSTMPTSAAAPSPPFYQLSSTASYHNAMVYNMALGRSNVTRLLAVSMARAKNKKEGLDPIVGKGPASLSFWQWLELGQMGLKIYGKVSAIVKALEAGDVVIDVWKLLPKVSVMNEDDPFAPALVMGLVPYSKSSIALAKQIVHVNDPRYYLGNLVKYDDLDRLVPSLAVKPSFYGALAHKMMSDPTSRNIQMQEQIMRNFHELRTSLSKLKRRAMGHDRDELDIARSRFSSPWAAKALAGMEVEAETMNDVFSEIQRGAGIYGQEFSDEVRALRSPVQNMIAAEKKMVQSLVQAKAADTWQAKAMAGAMTNIMMSVETHEYAEGIKKVQDMVNKYASDSDGAVTGGAFNHENILLGIAVADAWTNKLINDELRALRQIYALNVNREGVEKLAPYLKSSFENMNYASTRLARLRDTLAVLQTGQSAATGSVFFTGDDLARIATRMDVNK